MSTPPQINTERALANFAVGYHQILADVSLDHQMNRFSTGTKDMVADAGGGTH